jgi:hypothetical protein
MTAIIFNSASSADSVIKLSSFKNITTFHSSAVMVYFSQDCQVR